MLVMKFGGTSVGTAERIKAVANIIKDRLDKKPVVVVSAVAGTTNALIDVAKEKRVETRLEMVAAIRDAHRNILNGLDLDADLLDDEFAELQTLAKAKKKLDKKVLDHYVSFGERLSAMMLAQTLVKKDVNAKAFSAWELGMITDSVHGAAEPLPTSPALIKQKVLALKALPVITGYIGKTANGAIATLGRGGSDYSAAIIGGALKAEEIQIWKEVDGILTTDPKVVPEAQIVPELAFEEAAELAYFGAKVLHPKTILPAMRVNVPVRVLNTFKPENAGTMIVANFADRKQKSRTVEALTCKRNVIAIHVYSPEFFDGNGLITRLFEVFNKYRTSIDVVTTSVASVSVTVDKDAELEMIVRDLKTLGQVEVDHNKSIICAVGGSMDAAGVAGRMFTVLGENGISVEMISQEASGISMTFVVDEKDAEKALKVLHTEYIR